MNIVVGCFATPIVVDELFSLPLEISIAFASCSTAGFSAPGNHRLLLHKMSFIDKAQKPMEVILVLSESGLNEWKISYFLVNTINISQSYMGYIVILIAHNLISTNDIFGVPSAFFTGIPRTFSYDWNTFTSSPDYKNLLNDSQIYLNKIDLNSSLTNLLPIKVDHVGDTPGYTLRILMSL